jgi:hypothetical protein
MGMETKLVGRSDQLHILVALPLEKVLQVPHRQESMDCRTNADIVDAKRKTGATATIKPQLPSSWPTVLLAQLTQLIKSD